MAQAHHYIEETTDPDEIIAEMNEVMATHVAALSVAGFSEHQAKAIAHMAYVGSQLHDMAKLPALKRGPGQAMVTYNPEAGFHYPV